MSTSVYCNWCGALMKDIGQGGPSLTEPAPAWLRMLHCTRCDHERQHVEHDRAAQGGTDRG